LLILIPISYLIGSIPFGLLVGLSKGVDVRKEGSGNIGATNVGRLLGKKFFFIVFFLDLLKSLIPMLVASWMARQIVERDWQIYLMWLGVGFAAILGHMFSLFLGFKGGKGVATSAGMMLGLFPYYTLPGGIAIGVFILVFGISRIISLSSMVAACAFPVIYVGVGLIDRWPIFREQWPLTVFSFVIALLIVVKHRANISRLRRGEEKRYTTEKRKD
jgi:acyl phosphate:glycerol-3-phosphate acyltransferase